MKFMVLVIITALLLSMIPTGISLAAADTPQGASLQSAGEYQGPTSERPDISDIVSKKDAMTESEEKLSTALLQLTNSDFLPESMSQSDLIEQMKDLDQGTGSASAFEVYVYIQLNDGEKSSILTPYVSRIENEDAESGLVVAWVDMGELSNIAALDEVRSIREVVAPVVNSGSVTSEGDSILNADLMRSATGSDGSGVKVGIISDGVDNLSSAVSSGDLPGDVTVLSNTLGGDEGTAMLEIVYDLAPGADLYFHDCGIDNVAFCNAIDALVAAGCDVICDDIGWITEPFFEDGYVAQHLESVLSSTDVVYTSSAGNAASKHFQGTFYDDGYGFADFSYGSSSNTDLYAYLPAGGTLVVVMQWDDSYGSSSNDYDIYMYEVASGSYICSTSNRQNGNDDPFEYIAITNNGSTGADIAIAAYNYNAPVNKTLEIYMYSYGGYNYTNNIVAADSIFGHPAVPDAIACGAIDQADSGNDDIEYFSSCGPVTMVGTTRNKPDICGIDGVAVTGAGGFSNPFYGTSAAAPHIAAVAALLESQYPSKSSSDIRDLILDNGVDLGASGYDTTFGYGRCDALAASNAGASDVSVKYCTHVQNVGWQEYKYDGETAGTEGQALRLEGIKIEVEGMSNSIQYKTHVQNIGWQNWAADGAMSGTEGQALRLEAIEIQLTGTMTEQYDVYYRVHAENFGWMDWAKNGAPAGTAGYGYRLEAIQIVLVEKGGTAPGSTTTPYRDSSKTGTWLAYRTHVQNVGWQDWVSDGAMSGTEGQALRLEGINIMANGAEGSIQYKTHVQNIGWQDWVSDGELSGTTGLAYRLEAIQIQLSGTVASQYDIYYRVHAQNFGWMDWACNGASAGTAGFGYRLEGIEIVLVEKGGAAPGPTDTPFISSY